MAMQYVWTNVWPNYSFIAGQLVHLHEIHVIKSINSSSLHDLISLTRDINNISDWDKSSAVSPRARKMLVQRAVIHTDRSRGLFIDHPHILCPSRQIMSTYPHVKHMPFIPVHTDMNMCSSYLFNTICSTRTYSIYYVLSFAYYCY